MRSFRIAALPCAVAAALLVPTTAGAADAIGNAPLERSDLNPGDLVRVAGAGAIVPEPGHFVFGEALNDDGSDEIAVSTDSAGRVFVATGDSGGPGSYSDDLIAASNSPGPCSDSAWTHGQMTFQPGNLKKQYRWNTEFRWYFHSAVTPPEITASNALNDIIAGTVNMKDVNNDCGMADNSHATSAYQGTTGLVTQINTDNTCAKPDSTSVVGFGTLGPTNTLAYTCVWGDLNPTGAYSLVTTSDARFDKDNHKWFTGGVPSGCSGKWSLEGVATHERGHTFGLDHVSESTHRYLTMSPLINGACQRSEASLGRGDVLGMDAIYP